MVTNLTLVPMEVLLQEEDVVEEGNQNVRMVLLQPVLMDLIHSLMETRALLHALMVENLKLVLMVVLLQEEDLVEDPVEDPVEDVVEDVMEDQVEDVMEDLVEDVMEDLAEDVMEGVVSDTVEAVGKDLVDDLDNVTRKINVQKFLNSKLPIVSSFSKSK